MCVCFLKRDRKAVDLQRRRGRMELGGTEEEKTIIKTHYVRKKSIFKGRKNIFCFSGINYHT